MHLISVVEQMSAQSQILLAVGILLGILVIFVTLILKVHNPWVKENSKPIRFGTEAELNDYTTAYGLKLLYGQRARTASRPVNPRKIKGPGLLARLSAARAASKAKKLAAKAGKNATVVEPAENNSGKTNEAEAPAA